MHARTLTTAGRKSVVSAPHESALLLYLIKKLQQKSAARLEAVLEPFGITAVQFRILSEVGQSRNISSAELSRLFDVRPQSMSKQIAGLEAAGLISRIASTDNQRVLQVSLSPAGQRILDDCFRAARDLERDLFAGLTDQEREGLRGTLHKLLRSMN